MITNYRTNAIDDNFIALVNELDAELTIIDGDEHFFFDQFNKLDDIKNVIVAYDNGIAVGCGAIKEFDSTTMEIKRMFVTPAYRNKGIASFILTDLENWCKELSYNCCILETGFEMYGAIALYKKLGYTIISNYAQYKGVITSVCFKKQL